MKNFIKNYFNKNCYYDSSSVFNSTNLDSIVWVLFVILFISSYIEQFDKLDLKDLLLIPFAVYFTVFEIQPSVIQWRKFNPIYDKIFDHISWIVVIFSVSVIILL